MEDEGKDREGEGWGVGITRLFIIIINRRP
jgi:hypothetical protein